MLHVFEAIIESLDPLANPSSHRFNRRHSELGKPLKDAIIDHRRQCHARILNHIHRHEHKARITVLIPLTTSVMTVANEVNPDTEIKVLYRCPHRIKIWMTKAVAIDWHRC